MNHACMPARTTLDERSTIPHEHAMQSYARTTRVLRTRPTPLCACTHLLDTLAPHFNARTASNKRTIPLHTRTTKRRVFDTLHTYASVPMYRPHAHLRMPNTLLYARSQPVYSRTAPDTHSACPTRTRHALSSTCFTHLHDARTQQGAYKHAACAVHKYKKYLQSERYHASSS